MLWRDILLQQIWNNILNKANLIVTFQWNPIFLTSSHSYLSILSSSFRTTSCNEINENTGIWSNPWWYNRSTLHRTTASRQIHLRKVQSAGNAASRNAHQCEESLSKKVSFQITSCMVASMTSNEALYSHTPLVATPSWLSPNPDCKIKADKRLEITKSSRLVHKTLRIFAWVGGWESQQWCMQQKQLPPHRSHDPSPGSVWEKKFTEYFFSHSQCKTTLL